MPIPVSMKSLVRVSLLSNMSSIYEVSGEGVPIIKYELYLWSLWWGCPYFIKCELYAYIYEVTGEGVPISLNVSSICEVSGEGVPVFH